MLSSSEAFVPVMLRAVKIRPDQPLVFDFIVDSGNSKLSQEEIKGETEKLAKYFLATLTIPEKDLWVNLSPYEKDRIIPEEFGLTEMGKDLLAQDYILKQLTASLMYPEKELGKEFWDRVYAQTSEALGTTEIPTNTFNKVWIVPDKAVVYEINNTAIVGEAHLKVMMEEDYLALEKNTNNPSLGTDQLTASEVSQSNKVASQAVREIILPEIEKEVNQGKNFALLRQVYAALILATWYKQNLQDSLLGQVYADQKKINGVDAIDKNAREEIYQQYIAAYKAGVFNFIKEDVDPQTQEILPRKYFSGGADFATIRNTVRDQAMKVRSVREIPNPAQSSIGNFAQVTVAFARPEKAKSVKVDFAQTPPKQSFKVARFHEALAVTEPGEYIKRLGNLHNKEEYFARLAFEISTTINKKLILTDDGDAKEGVTYIVSPDRNSVEIHFQDQTVVQQSLDFERTSIIHGFSNRAEGKKIEAVVRKLAEDDLRLSDFGYKQRVTLKDVWRVINKAKAEGKVANTAAYGINAREAAEFLQELHPERKFNKNIPVFVVYTSKETFGIIRTFENNEERIYIEEPFVNRILELKNPFQMLSRSFVYAMNGQTHEENRIAEFEYAKKVFPDLRQRLEGDVVGLYSWIRDSDVLPPGERDEEMAQDILNRLHAELWEIGVHMMNGDISKKSRIRWNADDRPYDPKDPNDLQPVIATLYALAANPAHYGQIETVFRLMAAEKVSQIGYRIHAYDFRKALTVATNPDRQEMILQHIEKYMPGFFHHVGIAVESSLDGEGQMPEFLELNQNRPGPFTMGYLVGSDHMHWDAPDKPGRVSRNYIKTLASDIDKVWNRWQSKKYINEDGMINPQFSGLDDEEAGQLSPNFDVIQDYMLQRQADLTSGTRQPKRMGNGTSTEPDTIQKFVNLPSKLTGDLQERIQKRTLKLIVFFNERDPKDGVPMDHEKQRLAELQRHGLFMLLRGRNIQGVSSTNVRDALAGTKPIDHVTVLPVTFQNEIRKRDQYRGYIIGLPQAIKAFSVENIPPNEMKGTARVIRNWLEIAKENNGGQDLTAKQISDMFTLSEDIIQKVASQDAEIRQKLSMSPDVSLPEDVVEKALTRLKEVDFSMVTPKKADHLGGIDFDPGLLNMKVERTGDKVKVMVDPAELLRIRTEGVDGFRPVIINIVPVKAMLPALGLSEAPGAEQLVGSTS